METNKENSTPLSGSTRLLSVVMGLLFLVLGVTKFVGIPLWVDAFGRFQLPDWWVLYAVGAAEAAGGALLLLGRSRTFAAGALAVVMLGAFLTHLRIGEFAVSLVPLILAIPLALVLRSSRI